MTAFRITGGPVTRPDLWPFFFKNCRHLGGKWRAKSAAGFKACWLAVHQHVKASVSHSRRTT